MIDLFPIMSTFPLTDKSHNKFSLAWINDSIEHLEIPNQLQSIINHIRILNDVEKCEQIIWLLNEARFILVNNSEYGRNIIPRIHDLIQVSSIYIFDVGQVEHQQSIKDYYHASLLIIRKSTTG